MARLSPGQKRKLMEQAEVDAIEARRVSLLAEATSGIVKREAVLTRLRDASAVSVKDIFVLDGKTGRYVLKPLAELPDIAAWAIQSIRLHDTVDGQVLDVRLVDRTRILEYLGDYLGLRKLGDSNEHRHVHLHHADSLAGMPAHELEARLVELESSASKEAG